MAAFQPCIFVLLPIIPLRRVIIAQGEGKAPLWAI